MATLSHMLRWPFRCRTGGRSTRYDRTSLLCRVATSLRDVWATATAMAKQRGAETGPPQLGKAALVPAVRDSAFQHALCNRGRHAHRDPMVANLSAGLTFAEEPSGQNDAHERKGLCQHGRLD